ncbi:MAG: hypothetical protein ACRDSG_04525 [Pseudonocardiaceae bacterium]
MKLDDPPELVALCREDQDGEERVAGWVMVLADHVVGYVPDRSGVGAASYTFESLDSAEWILGYSGIYPRRLHASQDRGEGGDMVPHAVNGTTHRRRS